MDNNPKIIIINLWLIIESENQTAVVMSLWHLLHFIKTLIIKTKISNILLFSAFHTWRCADDFRCCSWVPVIESPDLPEWALMMSFPCWHQRCQRSCTRGRRAERGRRRGSLKSSEQVWGSFHRTKKLLRSLYRVAVALITIIFIMQESHSFVQDVYRKRNSLSVSDWGEWCEHEIIRYPVFKCSQREAEILLVICSIERRLANRWFPSFFFLSLDNKNLDYHHP